MITTSAFREEEAIINSSILENAEYFMEEDVDFTFYSLSCSYIRGSHLANYLQYNIEPLLVATRVMPHRSVNTFLEETRMTEEYPKTNSVEEIIQALLLIDKTEKIYFYPKGNDIRIWVVTAFSDAETLEQYCYLFADKVEQFFDHEHLFSFRIIQPESIELALIPPEATMRKRD